MLLSYNQSEQICLGTYSKNVEKDSENIENDYKPLYKYLGVKRKFNIFSNEVFCRNHGKNTKNSSEC